jgi:hypothetical protein
VDGRPEQPAAAKREKEPWDKSRNAANRYDMLEVKIEDWQGTPRARRNYVAAMRRLK